jgi:FtsZ family, C-terminal domain
MICPVPVSFKRIQEIFCFQRSRRHARNGQRDDGHRRSLRRQAGAPFGRGGHRQSTHLRCFDARRPWSADLDHRRPDLTLYEVDQAASRIREEADPDANIIVGATFDESLDGIIRVSVVATGVEINAANNVRLAMFSRALASPEIPVSVQRP